MIMCEKGYIRLHGPAHTPERMTVFKSSGVRGKFEEQDFDFPLPQLRHLVIRSKMRHPLITLVRPRRGFLCSLALPKGSSIASRLQPKVGRSWTVLRTRAHSDLPLLRGNDVSSPGGGEMLEGAEAGMSRVSLGGDGRNDTGELRESIAIEYISNPLKIQRTPAQP